MLISPKEKCKKPIFLFLDVTDMAGKNPKVQWRALLILSKNIVPDNIFTMGHQNQHGTLDVIAPTTKYAAFPSSSWTWQNTTQLKLEQLPYIKSQIILAWFIFSNYPVHTQFLIKRYKFCVHYLLCNPASTKINGRENPSTDIRKTLLGESNRSSSEHYIKSI